MYLEKSKTIYNLEQRIVLTNRWRVLDYINTSNQSSWSRTKK